MIDRDLILLGTLNDENVISWKFKMLLFDKWGCMEALMELLKGKIRRKLTEMEENAKWSKILYCYNIRCLIKHILRFSNFFCSILVLAIDFFSNNSQCFSFIWMYKTWETLCELFKKKSIAKTKVLQKKLLYL